MPSKTQELRGLLAAFGATHQNMVNLLLHVITFPFLVGSAAMLLACLSGPLLPVPRAAVALLPPAAAPYAVCTAGTAVLAVYSAYYVSFDPFAGAGWALLVALPAWLAGEAGRQRLPHAWAWALAVHVLGWCVQLAGHKIEGSPLAMKDSNNATGRSPAAVRTLPGARTPSFLLRAPALTACLAPLCSASSCPSRPSTPSSSPCSCWATAAGCTPTWWATSGRPGSGAERLRRGLRAATHAVTRQN
jgi:uncharacterized membrane protein YGL010W